MAKRTTLQDVEAAFGRLRDQICLRAGETPPQVLCVTSARRGEGRSTVAVGLARAFARALAEPTLLVDLDLTRPALHQWLGRPLGHGVSDLLRSGADPSGAIQRLEGGLWLLTAGSLPGEAGMLMTAPRLTSLVTMLRPLVGTVVIDAPALESGVEAQTVAAAADATLLVVRADRSVARDGRGAYASLVSAGANLVGVVLNDVRRWKGAVSPSFAVPPSPPRRVTKDVVRTG